MRWTLHVLKNDFLRVRMILAAWWVFLIIRLALSEHGYGVYLMGTLPFVAKWVAVALVLQGGYVANPKEFWLTLPISRLHVLASKALLLFCGIILPDLLVTGILVGGHGGLQFFLLMKLILASLALLVASLGLASITPNLRVFLGVFLAAYLLPQILSYWMWFRILSHSESDLNQILFHLMGPIVLIFGAYVVIYQYRTRNTRRSRILWVFLLLGLHLFGVS